MGSMRLLMNGADYGTNVCMHSLADVKGIEVCWRPDAQHTRADAAQPPELGTLNRSITGVASNGWSA